MIEANELRKGNLLMSPFGAIETVRMILGHEGYKDRTDVNKIYKDLIGVEENGNQYNLAEIKPITITEQLLLKAGFKNINERFVLSIGGFTIVFDIFKDIVDCYLESTGIDILFLHQLQNLYFTLTQTELNIKY